MAESYVQVQPDSTGKKLRTYEHAVGANTVHEEVMQVAKADGTKINPAQEDGNLATIAGDTTSLDGKVPADPAREGGNLATIAGDTTSIDGKITACNTGAVTVSAALPAGTNTIGKVGVHEGITYDHAHFDAAASGDLVGAAGAGLVIKVHALTIQAQGTVVVNLTNGNGGASLAEWSFQAREGVVYGFAPYPAHWLQTGQNTALYVTLSAAQTVTINCIYSDEDAS